MRKSAASQTAMWVGTLRGLARFDRPPLVNDPVAVDLLPFPYDTIVRAAERSPGATEALMRFTAKATRNFARHMAFRTRAIDDYVDGEARAGTEQLVLLGAGFDARAWRLASLEHTRVFEVDHPATQRTKREGIGGRTPIARDVVWASMDFTRDRLDEVLARVGHDASRPTTFVWEGVTMYLSREDLEATLRAIAKRSAAQSCLVATYRDAPQRSVEAVLDVAVRFVGEPFRTRLSPTDMRDLLRPHGFRVEHDEGSDTWSERYLGEQARPTSERLVVARHA